MMMISGLCAEGPSHRSRCMPALRRHPLLCVRLPSRFSLPAYRDPQNVSSPRRSSGRRASTVGLVACGQRSKSGMSAMALAAWMLAPVDGAVPAATPIDRTTLEALRNGEDICGVAGHRLSCLRATPCADVDGAVPCSASDAVWLPDDYQEQKGQAMLWRELLPLPAGPHPNEDALKASGKRLLCGTAAFFLLPRAVVLYEKPSKQHAQHCSRKYCKVPNELRALHPTDVAFPSSKKTVSRPRPFSRTPKMFPICIHCRDSLAFVPVDSQGFGGMYNAQMDLRLGLHREDILFAWCQLDHIVVKTVDETAFFFFAGLCPAPHWGYAPDPCLQCLWTP